MSSDTSVNVVVFEVVGDGPVQRLIGKGPTRAVDSVQTAWAAVRDQHRVEPGHVQRMFSEWEPTAEDRAFIAATFAPVLEVTYSFRRPQTEAGWEEALREAERTLRAAAERRAAQEAMQRNQQQGELMPVLRTCSEGDAFSLAVVHRPLGADLGVFLARVNRTVRNTLGIGYLMQRDLAASGRTAEEHFKTAYDNFARGLRVEAGEREGEKCFFVRHPMDLGASALGLPDFFANATKWTGAEEVFVGFTDPGGLFVTALGNVNLVRRFQDAVLASQYWGAVALTPACYVLTATDLRLVAARLKQPRVTGEG